MHAFIVASYEVTESSKFSPPLKKNQIIARGAIPMSMIAKAAPVSKGNIGDPYACLLLQGDMLKYFTVPSRSSAIACVIYLPVCAVPDSA